MPTGSVKPGLEKEAYGKEGMATVFPGQIDEEKKKGGEGVRVGK